MLTSLPKAIVRKIAHLYEEEEVDVYTLTLYCMSSTDMAYFEEKDRQRVKNIFNILIEDTKHHSELLKLMSESQ